MKKANISSPLTKRLLKGLGENIRLARLRRDLSLRAVAERAGLSINTVVAIENGESGVSIGAIANVLHCLGLAEDITLIARDDVIGRKLQDLELGPKKRATKKKNEKLLVGKK
ncbi:MAG: helix-turn-helix transcriptional regulator [Oligoflexia bacterium]|nr:helix-turn-helix transcriptional regulator [Oligoflexia bacterium]